MIGVFATEVAVLALLVLSGLACGTAFELRRMRRDVAAKEGTVALLKRLARSPEGD
ncbi:hypothetical protein SAMN05216298_3491 [Glycomyces sambucus]|uniref:Uncharacterized protein n=1 Tax=Glycomyces sambucus TaxID=380244 RepID=A0A1G9J8M5_9ACTN|nr:hypothetical protein [Glycomyces sambucus]SDL33828.1 hypothetical protein SAMN05216298_3491 [Glycomyces sambucus]